MSTGDLSYWLSMAAIFAVILALGIASRAYMQAELAMRTRYSSYGRSLTDPAKRTPSNGEAEGDPRADPDPRD